MSCCPMLYVLPAPPFSSPPIPRTVCPSNILWLLQSLRFLITQPLSNISYRNKYTDVSMRHTDHCQMGRQANLQLAIWPTQNCVCACVCVCVDGWEKKNHISVFEGGSEWLWIIFCFYEKECAHCDLSVSSLRAVQYTVRSIRRKELNSSYA